MRDPRERLRDILDAIAAIERYRDRGKAAFEHDELVHVWFLRHLQIIGEAVRGLPEAVRMRAPDVPWLKILGMRNIVVHNYFDIDAELVWEAVTRDIPPLRRAVELLLKTLEEQKP
jgi:uncharacterized protein with HEPN domain